MNKIEKRKYNELHYQKNREEILKKAKTRSRSRLKPQSILNVIPLFKKKGETEPTPRLPKSKRQNPILALFLSVLIAMMLYFLIKEMAIYYLSIDGNLPEAYLKAFILEGVVLLFTVLKVRGGSPKVSYQVMIGMIYFYTFWALSGSVVQAALQEETQVRTNHQVMKELEQEISKKETLRDHYFETDRVTLARKLDNALNPLKQKLEEARNAKSQITSTALVWNRLAILLLFRGLVMFANLLCVRELCRWFRFETRTC